MKAPAFIRFELNVECPHCEEMFDLIDHDDNDEGFWIEKMKNWLLNKEGADRPNEDVLCPNIECGKTVVIERIEY